MDAHMIVLPGAWRDENSENTGGRIPCKHRENRKLREKLKLPTYETFALQARGT